MDRRSDVGCNSDCGGEEIEEDVSDAVVVDESEAGPHVPGRPDDGSELAIIVPSTTTRACGVRLAINQSALTGARVSVEVLFLQLIGREVCFLGSKI